MTGSSDFTIHLAEGRKVYHPGELLRGQVEVIPDRDGPVSLKVAVGWETGGRGDREASKLSFQTLDEGIGRSGEPLRVPFEITLPEGPYSFATDRIELQWFVAVRWKVSLLQKRVEREYFDLLPGPYRATGDQRGDQKKRGRTSQEQERFEMFIMGGGVLFLSIIVGARMLSMDAEWFVVAMAGGLGLMGLALILGGLRHSITALRLGSVDIEVESSTVDLGGELPVTVHAPGLEGVRPRRFDVSLIARERAVLSGGRSAEASEDLLFLEMYDAPEGQTTFHHTFQVPSDGPLPFQGVSNQIIWEVEVHIEVPRWPAYKTLIPIDVMPAVQRPEEAQVEEEAQFEEEKVVMAAVTKEEAERQ